MVAIPIPTVDAIYQFHEDSQEGENRPHLGCSLIGSECDRYLWLTFRHTMRPHFPGRIIRLFKRGKLEESVYATELEKIGYDLDLGDDTGTQFRVSWHGGHFAGSTDGIINSGVLEAPKTKHILEIKTINDRGYKELVKKGVEGARPVYYGQCQTYMKGLKIKRCVFLATNKNTDEIYFERINYVAKKANALIKKAEKIITANQPPERLPDDRTCKWCDCRTLCHESAMPLSGCRTCCHSTPKMDGDKQWNCEKFDCDIDIDVQSAGNCPKHLFIPDIINTYVMVDANPEWIQYKNPVNGYVFKNGDRNELDENNVFSSAELSVINPTLHGDATINMVRDVVDGSVVESRDDSEVPF